MSRGVSCSHWGVFAASRPLLMMAVPKDVDLDELMAAWKRPDAIVPMALSGDDAQIVIFDDCMAL